ncbi:surface antigen-domain-containing protein [Podospora australis]|uniref:Surface antigen-domain-containing protein n=1 Tax=Podospora australis TaxID=1536484 RepID=A0AAN7AFV2_9PEZI|nr:surface antigen-domain-containing protein [Podospora australis]
MTPEGELQRTSRARRRLQQFPFCALEDPDKQPDAVDKPGTGNMAGNLTAGGSSLDEHHLTPASISSVEIHGATNTRRSLLDHAIKPLVAEGAHAGSTLGDVLERIGVAARKLSRFDIFKEEDFGCFISEAKASEDALPGDKKELDISFRVKEKSRLVFSAGTDFGNAEGSAYTNAVLRNIFGGAETLTVNASTGTRTRSAYNATFSAPINGNPDLRVALDGVRSSTQKPWASHDEHLTGGNIRFSWLTDKNETHTLAYSSVWRQLTGLAATASPTVRADAGDSLKSSIQHTYTRDRRDNPMLPQSGYLFRSVAELAGWGPLNGDVAFAKTEVETSGALPVSLPGVKGNTGISIGAGLRLGVLYPLVKGYSGAVQPSSINDRFQLGGPTDVRGFKLGGLGPHDGADSVGGDVFAAGSVNMLLPLPRSGADSPLRLQLFANGGRLVAMQNQRKRDSKLALDSNEVFKGVKSAVEELGNGLPSVAAGVGLVYAHPVARFELNFSLPLVLRKGEEGRKGLQVGVGLSFL